MESVEVHSIVPAPSLLARTASRASSKKTLRVTALAMDGGSSNGRGGLREVVSEMYESMRAEDSTLRTCFADCGAELEAP